MRIPHSQGFYVLSAQVVSRVSTTLEAKFRDLFKEPVDEVSVCLVAGFIHAMLDIVHEVCGKRQIKLWYLHTDNIGIEKDGRVVLLDVDTAYLATDGGHFLCQFALKTFFASLHANAQWYGADGTWLPCISLLGTKIFREGWKLVHEIPSFHLVTEELRMAVCEQIA